MFRSKTRDVTISLPQETLDAIFDECDRFDVDETGGRIVGTYRRTGKRYDITVLGVIGPGPDAQRSPTSFFQDGEYQERVFRELEQKYPDLEHLGNWHTHHVNGLGTLSSGDKATYQRTVNHQKHNTDFFYALLVVRKGSGSDQRYDVKHYLVFRNDETVYEVPRAQVSIGGGVDLPAVGVGDTVRFVSSSERSGILRNANLERVKDQEFFSEFYPTLKPGFSKSLGTLYWKGRVDLVDGSHADVLAMESSDSAHPSYSITIPGPNAPDVVDSYKHRVFRSARHAVSELKRDVDREIFLRKKEH